METTNHSDPKPLKPFACKFSGCGKSFQRKEHLNRHSLNHAPTKTFSCEKCGKQFYRRDLYNRHLERHVKNLQKKASKSRPVPESTASPERNGLNNHSHMNHNGGTATSTPSSTGTGVNTSIDGNTSANNLNTNTPTPANNNPSGTTALPAPLPSVKTPSEIPMYPTPGSIPTTMGVPPGLQGGLGPPPPPSAPHSHLSQPPVAHPRQPSVPQVTGTMIQPYGGVQGQQPFQQQSVAPQMPQQFHQPPEMLQQDVYGIGSFFQEDDLRWLFEGTLESMDAQLASVRNFEAITPQSQNTTSNKQVEELTPPPEDRRDEKQMWKAVTRKLKKTLFNFEDGVTSGSPLESCTLANTFSHDLMNTWITDPAALKTYFDIYFEAYHDHFPIVHKPTFVKRPDRVHPLLMISIVTMGTAFAPKAEFEVSVKLHERLRWLIFSHNELMEPPLWFFQSLVLLQAFEKMLSVQSHHVLAATFHGAMVNLLRRSQPRFSEEEEADLPLYVKWQKWIERESFRRTYFLAFIMDAQHVVLFGHRASMSANEILFELPCLEKGWEAEDANTWWSSLQEKSPSFLAGLKSLLMLKPLSAATSHYGRLILLHGLYSVAIHMQLQKGQTLGMINRASSDSECKHCGSRNIQQRQQHPFEQWKMILGQAINTWSYCLYTQKSITIEVCNAMHQMAYVTLHLSPPSVLDVLVLSKYPLLLDRRLSQHDFYKAERAIRSWARTNEAIMCVKHALLLIQETLFSRSNHYFSSDRVSNRYCANVDKIALRPWCLFICTLIVWSFHSSLCGPARGSTFTIPEDEENMWLITEQYVSTRIQALSAHNSQTALDMYTRMDLNHRDAILYVLSAVRSCLPDCRWEMLQQAHSCLEELITDRGT